MHKPSRVPGQPYSADERQKIIELYKKQEKRNDSEIGRALDMDRGAVRKIINAYKVWPK